MNTRRSFFSSLLAAACMPMLKFFPAPAKPQTFTFDTAETVAIGAKWHACDPYSMPEMPSPARLLFYELRQHNELIFDMAWDRLSECDRKLAAAGMKDRLVYEMARAHTEICQLNKEFGNISARLRL